MSKTKKPLREITYNKILEDILQGTIHDGEKLLEVELAEKFQVSRTPVREALIQLEREGFVVIEKDKGAVVKATTVKQVEDFYDIVGQLEGYATRMVVAQKITRQDISYLKALQKEMGAVLKTKNYLQYAEHNIKFHSFFTKRYANDALDQIVSDLRLKIRKIALLGLALPMHIDQYVTSHRNIINAVSSGNAIEAGKLMADHVHDAKIFLVEIMKQHPASIFIQK